MQYRKKKFYGMYSAEHSELQELVQDIQLTGHKEEKLIFKFQSRRSILALLRCDCEYQILFFDGTQRFPNSHGFF